MATSLSWLLGAFAVAILFVLIAIMGFKVHPFLALLLGSIVMGLCSKMAFNDISAQIASGFGGTLGSIGIIIVLGIILGELLHQSGCTAQIAGLLLRATGEKRAPLAVNLTGFVVSIPVFFDAAFILLLNLIKQVSRKGRIPFITLVTALAVGLITTHSVVIPTPGPLIVANNLGLNLGYFLFYSLIVAIAGSLAGGVAYGKLIGILPGNSADFANNFDGLDEKPVSEGKKDGPSGGLGIFLIFLPIAIILAGTVAAATITDKTSTAFKLLAFLGDKNIALLIGVLVAYLQLHKYIGASFTEIIAKCGESAGAIFIITGAGGAFGSVINATGIGKVLVESMSGWTGTSAGLLLIVVCFAISQILRAAQGSTTVALVTTSSIMAPIVSQLSGVSPILIGLAICAGGIGCSLPNDSGFWVVNRFSRFSVKQTIQCWTVGGTLSGLTVLACLVVLNFLSGVLPGL